MKFKTLTAAAALAIALAASAAFQPASAFSGVDLYNLCAVSDPFNEGFSAISAALTPVRSFWTGLMAKSCRPAGSAPQRISS
jgi:hypothetical protein